MNNKHMLQMISGVLLFLSFFSSWVYTGAFPLKPSEFVNHSYSIAFKLFLTLPLLGVISCYFGYAKKYKYRLNIINIAVCLILMFTILGYINKYDGNHLIVDNGFYLAGLAVLVSAASIIVMKKELKSKNISSMG
ncbi:hypothetical protein [Neobacillus sp. Marseille-QA0830]